MNEKRFNALLQELIDENPFAIRAVLKILDLEFTDTVPTLAVTKQSKPRLLVNLQFVEEHCHDDKQVKAVIIHEFLHVLLRHTEEKAPLTPARHLALDAVINAIIHRQYGSEYSAMMAAYYADVNDLRKLLRPMNEEEEMFYDDYWDEDYPLPQWVEAWNSLFEGYLIADDIEELVKQLESEKPVAGDPIGPFTLEKGGMGEIGDLLGNHADPDGELSDVLKEALEDSMKEMNGSGIWRSPGSRGVGANPYEALFTEKDEPMRCWERKTLAVLKQYLQPDRKSRAKSEKPIDYRLPVLSPNDRRAFMRSLWAPFLPEAQWSTTKPGPEGTAQIYLDVSGSMYAEMPLIVALLGRLSRYIRRPFWAFSDVVAPAVIENGQLKAETSGDNHIDRVGAYAARDAAVRAVQTGAGECLVRVMYAPNIKQPLDVSFEMTGRGNRQSKAFFDHAAMVARYTGPVINRDLARGRHFFDDTLVWNNGYSDTGVDSVAS